MSKQKEQSPIPTSTFNRYLILATPYFFIISIMYLTGYWSVFQINIFQYIGLQDVITLTLYHLMYSLPVVLFAFGMPTLLAIAAAHLFDLINRNEKIIYNIKHKYKFIKYIFYILITLFSIYSINIFYLDFTEGHIFIILLFTIYFASFFTSISIIRLSNYTTDSVRTNITRYTITSLLIAIPFFSYLIGDYIGSNRRFYGTKNIIKIDNSELDYTLVGYAGGLLFLYNKNHNQMHIKRKNNIDKMILNYDRVFTSKYPFEVKENTIIRK